MRTRTSCVNLESGLSIPCAASGRCQGSLGVQEVGTELENSGTRGYIVYSVWFHAEQCVWTHQYHLSRWLRNKHI